MVAARRLQQLGVAPTVLERGDTEGGANSARISGGLLHVAMAAMDEKPDNLYRRLMEETDGEIDPSLARVYADNAGRATEWLAAEGVEIKPKSDVACQRFALYPHELANARRIVPTRGPDRMMMTLYRAVRGDGGKIILGASAESLGRAANGGWTVTYRSGGRAHERTARAVVVADGGFQANAEMLSRYVGPNAAQCLLRAMPSATGAGLRMLMGVGAKAVGLGRVYGHMVSADALHNDTLWPYPSVDRLCLQGVLVDRRGDRFATRATDGVRLVTELARTEDPRGYCLIFDEALWRTAGKDNPYGTPVPNADLAERGGRLVSAGSLSELAHAVGLAPAQLERAVAGHNGDPGRIELGTAPYYAMPVIPGITFTMGGVKMGPGGQVLDEVDRPIPGLFAAGSATGGLHGGPRGGYVGGLAAALTFGLLAAEAIAASTRPSTPSHRRATRARRQQRSPRTRRAAR
jgi:fumarate reductase flavoprotein subunit